MAVDTDLPSLSSSPAHLPKRVAVIGGGPAGLIAARELLTHGRFEQVTVYERRSDLGGIWNVTLENGGDLDLKAERKRPDASATSSAYPQLHTNTPFNTIELRDFPIPTDADIFPTAAVVQGYLRDFAQSRGVYERIRFSAVVQSVTWNTHTQDWTLVSNENGGQVASRYDGVVVANGHYSLPYIPPISGAESFKGRLLHSRDFRFVEEFVGKNVVVVGSGSSALDLTRILAAHAKHIAVSIRDSRHWDSENVADLVACKAYPVTRHVPVKRFTEQDAEFEDGEWVRNVDVVIFATGYLYDFPFLRRGPLSDHGTQLSDPDQEYRDLIGGGDGEVVVNLWKKAFYAWNPTLAFVGLPLYINSFPFFEFQGTLIAKAWSGAAPSLAWPTSLEEVQAAEDEEAKKTGAVDRFDGKSMVWSGKPQFEYQDELTRTLGIWETRRERLKVYEDPGALWALRNRLIFGA
ncbi:FAD/NAD(P)-binding domain-containing protein [Gonapodya prolifera JEL478]|uniref:FAD/NAD(P)-binding domain-containing protein n=1 Tax=Gonapodya prolifera (strain JEL478) TaxID=1344416 RepID=A0A139AM95_GONPJ|nr:FAD/NAD(P)-binding domain-containing protein [Gonapodya prolifera JEL478]|eukprot:KXS17890.1 FAD/NAD(P)-binding domain-containing protein [Gonapodya prolifera JEL478]